GKYDGLSYQAAVNSVANDLAALGIGEKKVTFRLRDWGISRQRYWGTPIPMIHCEACGDVPVPEKDLPVVLPEDCVPDGSGNPLNKHEKFLKVDCPSCGKPARRETDTMDTFVDSSWYYMRYCSPGASDAMVDTRNDYWMPMDQYIGGIEHAVLHLLYARADTARLFTMFASPPEQTLEWSGAGVEGAHRFLRRVWTYAVAHAAELDPVLTVNVSDDAAIKALRLEMHKLLQQADHDYSRLQYNTVVSASMKMLNLLEATKLSDSAAARAALGECVSIFLRVLYPVAPHVTHALWTALGYAHAHGDVLDAPWPQVDSAALEQSHIELMVQVNGKLRGKITVAKDADKATIETAALSDDNVKKFVEGAAKKIIIVPGKLVNIVA
ncbi:MAG: leucine--tRNA ligase, partial [Oxalobacteraceae bacterium]|nr:leucine--tRNA ligase [Oxalobacteraceae bacterium]